MADQTAPLDTDCPPFSRAGQYTGDTPPRVGTMSEKDAGLRHYVEEKEARKHEKQEEKEHGAVVDSGSEVVEGSKEKEGGVKAKLAALFK